MSSVGTTFVPFFAVPTGNPAARSNVLASLSRQAPSAALAHPEVGVRSATAALALTPEFTARIDHNIREALRRRIPGWTLDGFVPAP